MAALRTNRQHPWRDEELLKRLYEDELMSSVEIAEEFDCSISTINTWVDRHDSITKRTRSEAAQAHHGTLNKVNLRTKLWGAKKNDRAHEVWWEDGHTVYVHRLLAVAEWGLDAVRGKEVHHKNEIGWDNRPENLELLTKAEHQAKHKMKVTGFDRLRIAELYEHGELGLRTLHEQLDYDIHPMTIRNIHKEFYGDEEVRA